MVNNINKMEKEDNVDKILAVGYKQSQASTQPGLIFVFVFNLQ